MRVYPVLARNDLSNNLLQFVDVRPNTSQIPMPFEGQGNTGYLTWDTLNDTVATTLAVNTTTDAVYDGLAAYLIDNVENVGGGAIILSDAECASIAASILARVADGDDLERTNINTLINAPAGVTNSDLSGVIANSHSTGSVEDILRILSGEVYRLPAASAVGAPAAAFVAAHVPAGAFLTAADADFQNTRVFQFTGSMNLSCLSGQLSKMNDGDFAWLNPLFTYGAAGTAETIAGVNIGVTGAGRAAVMYHAVGTAL